jgi:hypothetical protein
MARDSRELCWPWISEYCFKKAELGGHATREMGSALGKMVLVKKSSVSISSMVALLDGSLINILEMNFLTNWERGIESGKL